MYLWKFPHLKCNVSFRRNNFVPFSTGETAKNYAQNELTHDQYRTNEAGECGTLSRCAICNPKVADLNFAAVVDHFSTWQPLNGRNTKCLHKPLNGSIIIGYLSTQMKMKVQEKEQIWHLLWFQQVV